MVIGIPAIALILQTAVFLPLNFLLVLDEANTTLQALQSSVVSLLLLAVSYARVRRLEREYLALLWGYVTVVAAISSVAWVATYIGGVESSGEGPLSVLGRSLLIFGLAGVPSILALLWFARQASRLSLTHALFMVVFTTSMLAGPVQGLQFSDGIATYLAHLLLGGAITLSIMLLKVWLLGNCDLRGPKFRRNAIIGLVAATVLSQFVRVLVVELIGAGGETNPDVLPLLGEVFGIAAFVATTALGLGMLLVLFALVYLVRVRVASVDARADWAG